MRFGGKRWFTISATMGAFATIFIAFTPPATGFEPSIFAAYPIWIQALFAISLIGAIITAFRGAADNHKRRWLAAILLVLGLYVVLFALPVFRQYALFGRGSFDTLTHIGFIQTIVDTGHLARGDWYPSIHIIGSIYRFIGIPKVAFVTVTQSVFFPVFIFSIFIYTRQMIDERTAMFAGATALPLIFGSYYATIQPFLQSFMIFPLLLFAAKSTDTRWQLVMSSILFALIPFHPITAIIAISYLIFSWLYELQDTTNPTQSPIAVPVAGGAALTIWYSGFSRFGKVIISKFVFTIPESSGNRGEMSLTIQHAIIRAIEIYGDAALITGTIILSACILGIYIYQSRQVEYRAEGSKLLMYLTIGGVIGVALFIGLIGNPLRTGRYFFLFGVIAIGWLVSVAFRSQRRGSYIFNALVVITIVIAAVIGVGGVYPNGNHLTHSESKSVDWILDYTESETVLSLQMSRKITLMQRGFHAAPEKWRFQKTKPELQLPPHLGYENNRKISTLHEPPFYVLTKEHDTEYYQSSYPEQWNSLTWYSKDDLRHLRSDSAANRIYTTGFGKASIWYVLKSKSS